MLNRDYRSLTERADLIGKKIKEDASQGLSFFILSHFDADGLAAAGVIAKTLLRLKAPIHIRIVKQLDEEILKNAFETSHERIIFSELGSGYLDQISSYNSPERVFVIDHHPLIGDPTVIENHFNPNIFGYDGSVDLSGSGSIYFIAKAISNTNRDLAPLAVVGALGDMQDKNEKRELTSLNAEIVQEAVEEGHLSTEPDLIFYGRETRPIHKALANTTNPFIPGLSGREDNCLSLLTSINIALKEGEKWRTPADLTFKEKKDLVSRIVEHLSAQEVSGEITRNLIGKVYTLTKEKEGTVLRDAREFSSTLNACGRMDKYGIGVAICLGDRGSPLEEIEALIKEYRQTLARYMEWISQNRDKIQILKAIYIVRGEDYIEENMSGAISSMLSSASNFDPNKVLIVVTKPKDNEVKISARISKKLVEKEIHLGEILSTLSKELGGLGGGHNVAAGAKIPISKLEGFLNEVDKTVSGKLGL
ncbi:DHH family phosphoesterase [[Eubacterium] cellulosolvens]